MRRALWAAGVILAAVVVLVGTVVLAFAAVAQVARAVDDWHG